MRRELAVEVNRRGFLMGSLASALTVTAGGVTGLILNTEPSFAAEKFVVNVLGSYTFVDTATGCEVAVTVKNGVRRIISNGIPNHVTGTFPNSGNPNRISAQKQDYSISTNPKLGNPTFAMGALSGVAINGVLFDPGTAEYFNNDRSSGWNLEAFNSVRSLGLDQNNAHVQPTGTYHYHGSPVGLSEIVARNGHSPLVGWGPDGFSVYLDRGYASAKNKKSSIKSLSPSYQLKKGVRPSGPGGSYNGDYTQDFEFVSGSGDLDAANGRFQITPEFPNGTYCYIITSKFPYIPRAFVGTVSESFKRTMGGLGTNPRGAGNAQPNLADAAKKLGITEQQLKDALGTPPPDFAAASQKLGIIEAVLRAALGTP